MNVTVLFEGICTHVRRRRKLTHWLPVPHRVVLANARKGKYDSHVQIPDHEGTLYVDARYVREPLPPPTAYLQPKNGVPGYTWNLYGATVTVPSGDHGLTHNGPSCIPQLQGEPDLVLDPEYVDEKHASAETVDFFFDIDRGRLRDCCFGDAYGAALDLRKAEGSIVIRPFGGSSESRILLEPDAVVVVRHTAEECKDDDLEHFLLHYLIGGRKLPRPVYLLEPCNQPCKPCMPGGGLSLGVGCSSSNYP